MSNSSQTFVFCCCYSCWYISSFAAYVFISNEPPFLFTSFGLLLLLPFAICRMLLSLGYFALIIRHRLCFLLKTRISFYFIWMSGCIKLNCFCSFSFSFRGSFAGIWALPLLFVQFIIIIIIICCRCRCRCHWFLIYFVDHIPLAYSHNQNSHVIFNAWITVHLAHII